MNCSCTELGWGRASGWEMRNTQGKRMYICLCVSLYMLICTYVYGIAIAALQNKSQYQLWEITRISLTRPKGLLSGKFGNYAQHFVCEQFRKCNLCYPYRKLFKEIHVYINYIFLVKISKNKKI